MPFGTEMMDLMTGMLPAPMLLLAGGLCFLLGVVIWIFPILPALLCFAVGALLFWKANKRLEQEKKERKQEKEAKEAEQNQVKTQKEAKS